MNLITIENKDLRLSSNLDEYSFGKTNYNTVLSQEGCIFDGSNFKLWNFDDVKSFDIEGKPERIVFYCGSNPLSKNAKPLTDFFTQGGQELFEACKTVCQALTAAATNGNEIPVVGAGGILVDLSGKKPQALFLPEALFKFSANTLSKNEFAELQGGWLNESLKGLPAICFLRATIIYKALTGRLPYNSEQSPEERNADIFDHKFLPLEYCINGIDSSFAKEINNALKLTATLVNVPGRRQKGRSAEELQAKSECSMEQFEAAWKLSLEQKNTDDKSFEEKAASYMKTHQAKISTKRKLRRNTPIVFASLAAVFIAVIIIINSIQSKLDDYTNTGLSSTQTLQAFFMGVNAKDTVLLTNLTKGKTPGKYVDAISSIYVMHKQRLAYGDPCGFASPERWLFFISDEKRYEAAGLYGITRLKIDGIDLDTEISMQKLKDKPVPLTKEGNILLEENVNSVHKVEYYLLHTGDENVDFSVDKITETYTLTVLKNRWLITNIQTESKQLDVDCSRFKNDYYNQLEANDKNVLKSTAILRERYDWLPTENAMQRENDLINEETAHPYKELGL